MTFGPHSWNTQCKAFLLLFIVSIVAQTVSCGMISAYWLEFHEGKQRTYRHNRKLDAIFQVFASILTVLGECVVPSTPRQAIAQFISTVALPRGNNTSLMALYTGALAFGKADPNLVNSCREFRLLVLFAGTSRDVLRGKLIKSSLDATDVQYTALSYTWGDPTDPGLILLNNGYELPITQNLEAALRQFRLRTGPIQLWVDAICINQADKEEKNIQVAIMRSIYASARQTWVWLGSADTRSDGAMDTVQSFQTEDPSHDDLGLIRQEVWDSIGDLMRRSWWTRVWVIQEVLSAKRVQLSCGNKQIGIDCFVKLEEIRRNFAFRHIPTQPFANILSNWSLNRRIVSDGDAPLFDWMADTHKFDATLRRDRLYALLGLSSEESRDAIIPDYSDRTSDTLLSTQATAHFLTQQRRLLPLQSGFYKKADDLPLPSWVSDWSTSQAGYVSLVFQSGYRACGQYARATPEFLPNVKHLSQLPQDALLVLKGVIEDEVRIAMPMPEVPLYNGTDGAEDLRSRMLRREVTRSTCSDWKDNVDLTSNDDPTAFWRTIIANRLFDWTGPPGPDHGKFFTDWQAGIESEGTTDFRNCAVSRCAGRSFIQTRDGRLGLAPKGTKMGDYVCLFLGGDVPFVLRPMKYGTYSFVGEAYIHGIMEGELSSDLIGIRLRSFEIT